MSHTEDYDMRTSLYALLVAGLVVGIFGCATVVFGLSTSFILSLVALFFVGVADSFSVFIRNNLRPIKRKWRRH